SASPVPIFIGADALVFGGVGTLVSSAGNLIAKVRTTRIERNVLMQTVDAFCSVPATKKLSTSRRRQRALTVDPFPWQYGRFNYRCLDNMQNRPPSSFTYATPKLGLVGSRSIFLFRRNGTCL